MYHTTVRQSKKLGPTFVHFKCCKIEGTICPSPLLRLSNNGNQIAKVVGKGLISMYESHVGMQVPLELRIYIVQPQGFFDISDARDEQQKADDMNIYCWTGGGPNFVHSSMARIALKLLKWANDGILLDGSNNFSINAIGANVNENGRTSVNTSLNSKVQCLSGPVLVSDTIAMLFKTFNGNRCNGHHPTWERRFLWDKINGANGNTVCAFTSTKF